MDVGSLLAPLYSPLMDACGWTRTQRSVLPVGPGSLLEVGCGPAILASQVGADYVGVDIRMAMLVRSDQARVVCADAAALPFADGQFDTVVSTAFLGLLEPGERHAILWEMARVCRGTIRIAEPIAPLDVVRQTLMLSRQPLRMQELRSAGWCVRSVGPRIYGGLYTIVEATPQV